MGEQLDIFSARTLRVPHYHGDLFGPYTPSLYRWLCRSWFLRVQRFGVTGARYVCETCWGTAGEESCVCLTAHTSRPA